MLLPRNRLLAALAFLLVPVSVLLSGPTTEGLVELKKERSEQLVLVRQLLNGETTGNPSSAEHAKALDFEARWILYRIYNEEFHKPTSTDPKEPDTISGQDGGKRSHLCQGADPARQRGHA
jgi:hypothetical protein